MYWESDKNVKNKPVGHAQKEKYSDEGAVLRSCYTGSHHGRMAHTLTPHHTIPLFDLMVRIQFCAPTGYILGETPSSGTTTTASPCGTGPRVSQITGQTLLRIETLLYITPTFYTTIRWLSSAPFNAAPRHDQLALGEPLLRPAQTCSSTSMACAICGLSYP